jgi:hypothetical protein
MHAPPGTIDPVHARRAFFDCIQVFFNRRRLHSAFGCLSLAGYEKHDAHQPPDAHAA